MTAPAVVVVGDLVTDVAAFVTEPITAGSDAAAHIEIGAGGSAANTAAWLASTGTAVAFVGRVGRDDHGRTRAAELSAGGVELHLAHDAVAPTGTVVVVVTHDGERTMLADRGANMLLGPADLPPALFAPGRHLHLSGYTLLGETSRPAGLEALRLARGARMSISVDPSSVQPLRDAGAEAFLSWTDGVDLCLSNQAEASVLAGTADPVEAAGVLASTYGRVVVKLGAGGALSSDGTLLLRAPAVAGAVVDTTGAGDAFAAGYLSAMLAHQPPDRCLRAGASVAAVAVAARGARPPTGP